MDELRTIDKGTPISVVDEIGKERIGEIAESCYGLGNRWAIDWEKFYELLESYGWDMQDLGGRVDNKIRRIGRERIGG